MKFKLPIIVSAAVMRELAPKDETHAVRIMLLNSIGPVLYTLRGLGRRKGKYLLERDAVSGRHTLDIPCCIWNDGIPTGKYHDNTSIVHDLLSRPNPLAPFVIQIVPWSGGQASPVPAIAADAASPLLVDAVETICLRLFSAMVPLEFDLFATPAIKEALGRECSPIIKGFLQDAGRTDLLEFIETITAETSHPPAPEPAPPVTSGKAETPAAKRMREKRARDKAAKAAKANLQPA